MIWGIIALILLLIIIGLVIWLLVRNSNTNSNKAGVNQACNTSADCNGGLVCSVINGITGMTGSVGGVNVGVVAVGGGRVCKVAYGGVCSANTDCASGQSCMNGVCSTTLGTQGKACPCDSGFTCVSNVCRAIVGQACMSNTDCSTGICMNNICMPRGTTGMSGSTGNTGCWDSRSGCDSNSRSGYDSSDSRHCRDSDDSRRSHDSGESRHCRDSSDSHNSRDDSESHNSRDDSESHNSRHDSESHNSKKSSSEEFTSCSDSNCGRTAYSLDSSSSFDCSEKKCKKKCESSLFDSNNSNPNNSSSASSYTRRGVYVTDQQNRDRTLFTAIEQPIIDVVKTDKTYLLLKNGNVAANAGINNTIYITDKKMSRMVRFGNEIVGLGKKGSLYQAVKSGSNTWRWEHLKNFPCDVVFINSTNTGTNLEVMTAANKAYLYAFSGNWKEGNKTNTRKTSDPRFYGKDVSRFLDLNERDNIGKTNDGVKIKHCKGAGFYPNNSIIAVLDSDTFTHVRIIDNDAYFLFEQN
jgi:hypothetical protein